MGFFDGFPWANGHQLNLDYFLKKIGVLEKNDAEQLQSVEAVNDRLDMLDETITETVNTAVGEQLAGVVEGLDLGKLVGAGFMLDNVVCFGDSLLQGFTPVGVVKSWGAALQEMCGGTFRYFGEGGAGFSQAGQDGHTMTTLVEAVAVPGMTEEERNAVNSVICIAGVNDTTTISPAGFIAAAKAAFPNAKIVVGCSPSLKRLNPDIVGALYNAVEGAIVLTGSNDWLALDGMDCGDGLHPNEAGQIQIAKNLDMASKGFAAEGYSTMTATIEGGAINYRKTGHMLSMWISATLASGSTNRALGAAPTFLQGITQTYTKPFYALLTAPAAFTIYQGSMFIMSTDTTETTVSGVVDIDLRTLR